MFQLHVTDSLSKVKWFTPKYFKAYLLPVTYVTGISASPIQSRLINQDKPTEIYIHRKVLLRFLLFRSWRKESCCCGIHNILTNKVKEHICKTRIIINIRFQVRAIYMGIAFKIKREKLEICVLNRNQYHHPLCSSRATEEYPGTNIYNKLFISHTKLNLWLTIHFLEKFYSFENVQ